MSRLLEEYQGQRVEVRRDSRSQQWSVFMDNLLLDKVESISLSDVQFSVLRSKAQRRQNNAASVIRGTILPLVPKPNRGFTRVHYPATRSTTWLLVDYAVPVTKADFTTCQGNGDVLIPTPLSYSHKRHLGVKGRRPTKITQKALARQLMKVGADFWLTDDQPLKERVRLAECGLFEPQYAILACADPWHDVPMFFERLPELRAWIATQRDLPRPDLVEIPPKKEEQIAPLPLPFDMVSYYRARVEEVGWVFYPGAQPMDWADNGKMVYVLMQRTGPATSRWENFTFRERQELEDWLYIQEN